MKHYDYLIVGSGLYGATFAYCAAQAGHSCLVIDRRPHLGGNVYCEDIEGINVHRYGPHIFHTSDKRVWQFVTSIVEFNNFINTPLAKYQGRVYNLPFNMNTFYQMWGVPIPDLAMLIIDRQRKEALADMKTDKPSNLEEQALLLVGRDIYETLIKGYTEKQWGRPCTKLPADIIRRLPVRFTFDNNYFRDPYQGIPVGGYNTLIKRLLKHAVTLTDADFFADRAYWESRADRIVYTGPLDQYFDYSEGRLAWRSVRFEDEIIDTPNHQGVAIVNYTDRDIPYTRIVEHKHFQTVGNAIFDNPRTVITREYPCEYPSILPSPSFSLITGAVSAVPSSLPPDPFYPINDHRNNALADRYRDLALQERNVIFGGRLADYRYYDMDNVIAKVLSVCPTVLPLG